MQAVGVDLADPANESQVRTPCLRHRTAQGVQVVAAFPSCGVQRASDVSSRGGRQGNGPWNLAGMKDQCSRGTLALAEAGTALPGVATFGAEHLFQLRTQPIAGPDAARDVVADVSNRRGTGGECEEMIERRNAVGFSGRDIQPAADVVQRALGEPAE